MLVALALGYLILSPAANYAITMPVLLALGLRGSIRGFRSQRLPYWVAPFLWFALWGAWSVTIGAIRGNDSFGLLDTGVSTVLGAALWLAVAFAADSSTVRWIPTVVALAVIGVSVVTVGAIFGFEVPILSDLNPTVGGSRSSGFTKARVTSVSSLLPAVPFLMGLAVYRRTWPSTWERVLSYVALGAGLVGLLLAGRQGGFLAVGVALILIPLVPLHWSVRSANVAVRVPLIRLLQMLVLSSVAVAGAMTLGINPASLARRFVETLGLGGTTSELTIASQNRFAQIEALLRGFSESWLFGNGAGAEAAIIRSVEHPWRYEMQYHLLLFEGGIVGAVLFLGTLRSGWKSSIRGLSIAADKPVIVSAVVAATAFLVATSTNPYLRQTGLQWWVFLPLMLLAPSSFNVGATGRQQKRTSVPDTQMRRVPSGGLRQWE